MNSELLIKIAQKGYNVAYGANINFATYDIVKKIPGYVSFLSIIVGILGLVYPPFAEKYVSVFILILGIASAISNALLLILIVIAIEALPILINSTS